jgi:hypothetical protein
MVAFFTPHTLPIVLEQIRQGAASGNEKMIRLWAELTGLIKSGGVNVTTNVGSGNTTTNNVIAGPGFDSIVRSLDAKRKAAQFGGVTIEAKPTPQLESER